MTKAELSAFRFQVLQQGAVVRIEYAGYMAGTEAHLHQTEAAIRSAPGAVGITYEVADLTSFHRSQVRLHADLFSQHATKIRGIAVVGAKPMARFGATTAGLLSRVPLRTFDTLSEATTWLATLDPPSAR